MMDDNHDSAVSSKEMRHVMNQVECTDDEKEDSTVNPSHDRNQDGCSTTTTADRDMKPSLYSVLQVPTNATFPLDRFELDDFIATYGDAGDNDSNGSSSSSVSSDPFGLNRILEDRSNALADEIQRELDDQIQQALQEQLDQQLEEYLHAHSSTVGYYDFDDEDDDDHHYCNSDSYVCASSNHVVDSVLDNLSERFSKALRLQDRVPTVAEINEDIQKVVDRYLSDANLEQTEQQHNTHQKQSKRQELSR